MRNLIFLIILTAVGCSYKYDTNIQNENNLLKSLLLVNNNTYINNKVANTTTTTTTTTVNGGITQTGTITTGTTVNGGATQTGTTTTVTTTGSGGSVSTVVVPAITAANYYIVTALTSPSYRFFSYYEAETVCASRGMDIVTIDKLPKFEEIMNYAISYPQSATQTEYDMRIAIQNGYYRYWVKDTDDGLADNSVAYAMETRNLYPLKIDRRLITRKNVYNNSVMCFK